MSNLTPRINKLEKNLVLDGSMDVWAEGDTRAHANNTRLYSSVLMSVANNVSGVSLTTNRQPSVPANSGLVNSNELSKTASGTLASNTAVLYDYFVEGYDTVDIYNSEFSMIFWVKSSVASLRSVSIRSTTGSHSFVQQYNINQANVWELKVFRFPALSTCPGTIDRTNGIGTSTRINVVSGATYQTATLNQWVAGDFVSGVGEDTTWLTGTNHNFSITGLMLVPGDLTSLEASSYQYVRSARNFAQELTAIFRYWENGGIVGRYDFNNTVVATVGMSTTFSSRKRAIPTVTLTDNSSGNWSGGASLISSTDSVVSIAKTMGTGGVTTRTFNVAYAADARF